MPLLYIGGSFIGKSDDATKRVTSDRSIAGPRAGPRSDENTVPANGSPRIDTPGESVDLTQIIRVDGPGTKYAAAEKKAKQTQQIEDRMYALKQEAYSDKEISKKIEDEFGVILQPKSVTAKLPKIVKKKREEEDQRLDEELSDWHVGEDEKLYAAYNEVEKKIEAEIQKLQAKKWNEVSKQLAYKMRRKKYTGTACKERFDGLLDGTALLPIELDPDQEGRRVLREARIAEAKRLRAEAEAAAQRAVEAKRQAELERKAQVIQRKIDRKNITAANKAEREADRKLKQEIADAKAEEMRQRREAQRRMKQKKAQQEKVQELENLVYSYYTGKYLQRRHRININNGGDEDFLSDEEEDHGAHYLLEGDQVAADGGNDRSVTSTRKAENGPTGPGGPSTVRISKQTLLNPRSIMTDHELELLLAMRGLPRRKAGETHPQLVARLAAADKTTKMEDLEALLGTHFASRKGTRQAKAKRLQEEDAKASEAGKRGIKSTDLEFKRQYEGYHGKAAKFIKED